MYSSCSDPWAYHREAWKSVAGIGFDESYRGYLGLAFFHAYRILKCKDDAEDAASVALWRAFASVNSFDGRSEFNTWIIAITRKAAIDAYRNARRKQVCFSSLTDFDENCAGYEEMPVDKKYCDQIRVTEVKAIVSGLPRHFREPFELYYYQGFEIKEISKILDIPEGTVKNRLSRTRRRVRIQIDEERAHRVMRIQDEPMLVKRTGHELPEASCSDIQDLRHYVLKNGVRYNGKCYFRDNQMPFVRRKRLQDSGVIKCAGRQIDLQKAGIGVKLAVKGNAMIYEVDSEIIN